MSQNNVQLQNGNGPLAGLRNQVINGGFQVWQRGTSFTGSGTSEYMADRWYVFNANGRSISRLAASPKGVEGNSLLMTNNTATNVQFRQGIELPQPGVAGAFSVGTIWTFSFYSDQDWTGYGMGQLCFRDAGKMDDLAGQTSVTSDSTIFSEITDDANTNDGIPWRRFSVTFTVTGSPTSSQAMLLIAPSCPSGGLRFSGCQLEPGPVATPFENRPQGLELSLCQRYYQKVGNSTGSFRLAPISATAGDLQTTFTFPTEMRVTPSVTMVGVGFGGNVITVDTASITENSWRAVAQPSGSVNATGNAFFQYYTADAEF